MILIVLIPYLDWSPATKESVLTGSSMGSYLASKTLAERELWAFADEHPGLEITTRKPDKLELLN